MHLKCITAVFVLDPVEIEEDEPLPLECIDLLERIIPTSSTQLTVKFLNVHKQTVADSGILVVALASDLCLKPENIFNMYKNVRSHLFACLQNDSIASFESESRDILTKITNVITVDRVN